MRVYKIGGNEVRVMKRTLLISDKINERTTCSFIVVDPTFEITKGMEVVITDGVENIFSGKVFKPKSTGDSIKEISVSCTDYSTLVDKRIIAESYENMLAGDIVKDFILKYFIDEGITEGAIQDGPIIEKAVFNYDNGNKALNYLSDLTSFFWEVDKDKKLNFFDRATYNSPFDLTDTSLNYNGFTVEEDASNYRNRQYLRAGQDISTLQTREFKGDGETAVWAVDLPIAKEPTIKVNGVIKTIGLRGLTENMDFYWSHNDKTISQDRNGVKLTTSSILTVEFNGYYPIIVVADSIGEINTRKELEGGSGLYENVMEESSLDTRNSALDYTNKMLDKYGFIAKVVNFDTHIGGLRAGQLINIKNSQHNVSGDYLIESVTTRDDGAINIYSIKCLDGSKLGGWEKFFRGLVNSGKRLVIRENEILVKLNSIKDNFLIPKFEETMTFNLHQYLICNTDIYCSEELII